MSRRGWLVVLWLYALAAAADMGWHFDQDRRAGRDWLSPANIAVTFSAGLFWPLDLVAQALLAESAEEVQERRHSGAQPQAASPEPMNTRDGQIRVGGRARAARDGLT